MQKRGSPRNDKSAELHVAWVQVFGYPIFHQVQRWGQEITVVLGGYYWYSGYMFLGPRTWDAGLTFYRIPLELLNGLAHWVDYGWRMNDYDDVVGELLEASFTWADELAMCATCRIQQKYDEDLILESLLSICRALANDSCFWGRTQRRFSDVPVSWVHLKI